MKYTMVHQAFSSNQVDHANPSPNRQLFLIKGDSMYETVELNLIELPTIKMFNLLVQFCYFYVYAVLNTVTVYLYDAK